MLTNQSPEIQKVIDQYAEMGRQWAANKFDVKEWQLGDRQIKLNKKQQEFLNSRERFSLISGGFAAGKTLPLLMKMVLFSLWFPNNRILLGRKTRSEIERATLPDLFDLIPQEWYEYRVGPGIVRFFNGSEIICFGLDALQSGNQQDTKKAEQAIKSLNLGAVFIDQLEEIEQRVYEALDGRLRRQTGFNQMNATTNPANFWAYDYFKKNPRANTRLVETSMLDNKDNLPEDFIQSMLLKPKHYVQKFVYGEWSPDSLVESCVFPSDYVKEQAFHIKHPQREFDGIKIFKGMDPKMTYQIGVDPSEGEKDPCHIVVICKETGEEVANFTGFVPISVVAEKTIVLASIYTSEQKPLVVPEVNGAGLALVEYLKERYGIIYEREIFSYRDRKNLKKLGFQTNFSTKRLLIEHFIELLSKRFPKIRDANTLEEMKTFIYTNEARRLGAGAQQGYHDDRVMATMLAFWGIQPTTQKEHDLQILLDEKGKGIRRKMRYKFI